MGRFLAGNGVLSILYASLVVLCGCGDDDGVGPVPGGDVTAPTITAGPTAREVTASSAEIRWTTDESSFSTVLWASDTTVAWQEILDSTLVIDHSVTVDGLVPETRYFFAVRSTDAPGNASPRSEADSFHTFSVLPTIVVDPWETTVPVGDSLRLAIRVLNVTDLFGAALDIGPLGDGVCLSADTLSAGPFLGEEVQALLLFDSDEDLLEVAMTRLYPAGGVDGNGTLAWVCLTAMEAGDWVVGFRDGSVLLKDPSGQPIPNFEQLVTVESTIRVGISVAD
jgi:hypothetical protein